jgi:hypothetical protein
MAYRLSPIAYHHPSLWRLASAHSLHQCPQAKRQLLTQKTAWHITRPPFQTAPDMAPSSPIFTSQVFVYTHILALLPSYRYSIYQKSYFVKRLSLNFLVEMRGLEPLTSSVQGRRSPSELHPQLAISYWLLAVGGFPSKANSQQPTANHQLVGLSGLEPETFPLSEECSSRLS